MARRRKSWSTRVVVLCVLVLAVFGSWTLYQQNQEQVNDEVQKVSEKAKQVKEVLRD